MPGTHAQNVTGVAPALQYDVVLVLQVDVDAADAVLDSSGAASKSGPVRAADDKPHTSFFISGRRPWRPMLSLDLTPYTSYSLVTYSFGAGLSRLIARGPHMYARPSLRRFRCSSFILGHHSLTMFASITVNDREGSVI